MSNWQDTFFTDDNVIVHTEHEPGLRSYYEKKYEFALIVQYGPDWFSNTKEDEKKLSEKIYKRLNQVVKLNIPDSTVGVELSEPVESNSICSRWEELKYRNESKTWAAFQVEQSLNVIRSRDAKEWVERILWFCNITPDRQEFFRLFASIGAIFYDYSDFRLNVSLVYTDQEDRNFAFCSPVLLDAPVIDIAKYFQEHLGTFYMCYPKKWYFEVYRIWEAFNENILKWKMEEDIWQDKYTMHHYIDAKRKRKNPIEKLNLSKKFFHGKYLWYNPARIFKLTKNTG